MQVWKSQGNPGCHPQQFLLIQFLCRREEINYSLSPAAARLQARQMPLPQPGSHMAGSSKAQSDSGLMVVFIRCPGCAFPLDCLRRQLVCALMRISSITSVPCENYVWLIAFLLCCARKSAVLLLLNYCPRCCSLVAHIRSARYLSGCLKKHSHLHS